MYWFCSSLDFSKLLLVQILSTGVSLGTSENWLSWLLLQHFRNTFLSLLFICLFSRIVFNCPRCKMKVFNSVSFGKMVREHNFMPFINCTFSNYLSPREKKGCKMAKMNVTCHLWKGSCVLWLTWSKYISVSYLHKCSLWN